VALVGYENSFVVLDGRGEQSVSGRRALGAAAVFIDAYDMARFGYLTLRRGRWKDRQVLVRRWVEMALTPTPAQPDYAS
jgi:CubicO group peptidase (beta-lactamase class C family)